MRSLRACGLGGAASAFLGLALAGCQHADVGRAWISVDRAGYADDGFVQVYAEHAPGELLVTRGGAQERVSPSEPRVYRSAAGDVGVYTYAIGPGAADLALAADDTVTATVPAWDGPGLRATGLAFFDAQGCGPGDHALHGACHLYASLVDGDDATMSGDALLVRPPDVPGDDCKVPTPLLANGALPAIDVEGGWHDAGDYLKFATTTSTTAVLLVGSALLHPDVWDDDTLLSATRPGLDWLLRLHPDDDTFVYQVGDERDHDVWRLPEDDTVAAIPGVPSRPAYACGAACANLAGRAAAALALASEAYASTDPAFASTALTAARADYAYAVAHPGVQDPCPVDFYEEPGYLDDLQLGAAALARVTGEAAYLDDAVAYAAQVDGAGPPGWADSQVFADVLLAGALAAPDDGMQARARAVYEAFDASAAADPTGWAGEGDWGSVAIAAGYANACDWLGSVEGLTPEAVGGPACAELARQQVHAALGVNPFGVPYMVGVAEDGPQHAASPLSDLSGVLETGAVVGGPGTASLVDDQDMPLGAHDRFADRQSPGMVYHDDVEDYVTNEPALDYTAQLVAAIAAWDR